MACPFAEHGLGHPAQNPSIFAKNVKSKTAAIYNHKKTQKKICSQSTIWLYRSEQENKFVKRCRCIASKRVWKELVVTEPHNLSHDTTFHEHGKCCWRKFVLVTKRRYSRSAIHFVSVKVANRSNLLKKQVWQRKQVSEKLLHIHVCERRKHIDGTPPNEVTKSCVLIKRSRLYESVFLTSLFCQGYMLG